MQFTLPKIKTGDKAVPATWYAGVEAWLRAITPRSGDGVLINTTANGTSYVADNRGGGNNPLVIIYPFSASLTITTTGTPPVTTATVSLTPGVVNQVMPGNMFTPLDVPDDLDYVKLHCNTNGKAVTSVDIVCDDQPPDPTLNYSSGSPPTDFEILLATIVGQNTVYQPVTQTGNVVALPKLLYYEGTTPATLGAEPFTRWYGWLPAFVK